MVGEGDKVLFDSMSMSILFASSQAPHVFVHVYRVSGWEQYVSILSLESSSLSVNQEQFTASPLLSSKVRVTESSQSPVLDT
jgi:hypothetical protein